MNYLSNKLNASNQFNIICPFKAVSRAIYLPVITDILYKKVADKTFSFIIDLDEPFKIVSIIKNSQLFWW